MTPPLPPPIYHNHCDRCKKHLKYCVCGESLPIYRTPYFQGIAIADRLEEIQDIFTELESTDMSAEKRVTKWDIATESLDELIAELRRSSQSESSLNGGKE